jgi:hypothetical protein
MKREHGGILTLLLIVILLLSGGLFYRYQGIASVDDPQTVETIRQQLQLELAGGSLRGLVNSLGNGSLQDFANQAMSLVNQKLVIVELQASRPLLAFSDKGETLYKAVFNLEQGDEVLATETQYLRYEKTLEGLRYRGTATEQAFNKHYFSWP